MNFTRSLNKALKKLKFTSSINDSIDEFIENLTRLLEEQRITHDISYDQDELIIFKKKKTRDVIFEGLESGNYNFIPSNKKGHCHRLLVAMALGGASSADGFYKTMIPVVRNWFSCLDKNSVTIIITEDWSENHFKLWEEVISAYKTNHSASVYILMYDSRFDRFDTKLI